MNKLHKFRNMNAWFTDSDSEGWVYLGSYYTLVARVNSRTNVIELFPCNVRYSSTTSKQVTTMLWELFDINLPSKDRSIIERDTLKHGMDTGEMFLIPRHGGWYAKTNYYGAFGTVGKALVELGKLC